MECRRASLREMSDNVTHTETIMPDQHYHAVRINKIKVPMRQLPIMMHQSLNTYRVCRILPTDENMTNV